MAQVKFVDGLFVEEKTFDNGGSIIKLGVKIDQFVEYLYENKKEDSDYINIDLKRGKESNKMYAQLNTFKKAGE